jgi:6-pyruvoyltetrahydropterin/6-carboxytetrahydropterin synthase
VEVSVVSNRLGKEGVVTDFGILKQKVEKVLKLLDHTYLNDLPYFSGIEPSSENIAKYIYDRLKNDLKGNPGSLKKVTAWESETASATYFGR